MLNGSWSYSFKKCFLEFFIASLLITINCFSAIAYVESVDAYLFIAPSMYIAEEVGEIFNMGVNISFVENLYSFEFGITFNSSLLSVVNVIPGQFFPQPPKSRFEFEKNDSLGFVRVNMSLVDSETPRSGNGTLVWIFFKVIQGSESCISSPINLKQTLLLNSELISITHDTNGAVFFWKSMQRDPPLEGRLLDLYTQKGGEGLGEPGGTFMLGEMLYLISRVTYNNEPVQQKLVSFEVLNVLNESVVIKSAITNEEGLAMISFRIPFTLSNVGIWKAISVVSIAGEVVWDTIDFQVYFRIPVGGHTFSVKKCLGEELLVVYFTIVIFLATVLSLVKRKKHKVFR